MSKEEAMKLALETAEGIVNANWREWHELASPEEFERWVKSRANHMAVALREALAEQPAQQEPVAIANGTFNHNCPVGTPLYTSPPQRTWVGLTNKDIYDCEPKTDWYDSVEFAKAIEAKLREKNNG